MSIGNAIGLQRFWSIVTGMNASMTHLAKLRLSLLGYIILGGVAGTIGTCAIRLYVAPGEPVVVASASQPTVR